MPQMAPLNWLILMLYFSSILILFNLFIFTINTPSNKKYINQNNSNFNWKW
uniref:ATP synthase complex subunit 8 n=1 Tax=Lucidina sp. FM13 TaxID=2596686 RepID=A0A5C0PZV9_9COLE|nr:ATP synthase F0 subunit 8 [Lucidina sp. FM13]